MLVLLTPLLLLKALLLLSRASQEQHPSCKYFTSAEILKCEVSSLFLSQMKNLPVILHYSDTEKLIIIVRQITQSSVSDINSLFQVES